MANMVVLLPETVSKYVNSFPKVFNVEYCWGCCLFVLANVRQYLEMGGVTGWHVTTIRRWHDLL